MKMARLMSRRVIGLITGRYISRNQSPLLTAPPSLRPTASSAPGKSSSLSSGIGAPSVYHALVIIFLEYFAWGLLTTPMIAVLNETFPDHTFLMNGLIVGIKGILSFLSAPLLGALSDVWGRKGFLLVTVFFTCAPIPLMHLNTWWYFATISISGVFAVTFSVVFAYVADVTEESERSAAYGLVSATFAASLVTSPALGAFLASRYDANMVVALATAVAVLDVLFILVAVPESLPDSLRPSGWERQITWQQVDPFLALRNVGADSTVRLLCGVVLLSFLPEAGQYSCFFVYLRLVMRFSQQSVALFIAVVGVLSVIAQTSLLAWLMRTAGAKHTIVVGLVFEMLQLIWFGFGSQVWMMWAAGVLAAIASITYPAISAFVSMHAEPERQGVVQGVITGIRGLCNGLGPALFGFIFYMFHVDLEQEARLGAGVNVPAAVGGPETGATHNVTSASGPPSGSHNLVPGPPFAFGGLLVVCALLVATFIDDSQPMFHRRPLPALRGVKVRRQGSATAGVHGSVGREADTSTRSDSSSELLYEYKCHKKNDSLDIGDAQTL